MYNNIRKENFRRRTGKNTRIFKHVQIIQEKIKRNTAQMWKAVVPKQVTIHTHLTTRRYCIVHARYVHELVITQTSQSGTMWGKKKKTGK